MSEPEPDPDLKDENPTKVFIKEIISILKKNPEKKQIMYYQDLYFEEKPDPDQFYCKPIMVVCPYDQFKFSCREIRCKSCNTKIKKKGLSDKYRRVINLKESYYIIQQIYYCGCEKDKFFTALNMLFENRKRFSDIPEYVIQVNI